MVGRPAVQAFAVALTALVVYGRTLAPTVMWYDMGEFATAALTLGIAHNTGYPLYILLGKLFSFLPLGDPAYRINFMSAFFGALTVFVTYLTIDKLTRQRGIALAGSLLMAFSSTLWGNATWAEAYTLNAFLTILILFLLLDFRETESDGSLLLATFLFGLGLGNHRLLLGMGLPLAYAGLLRFGGGWQRPFLRRLGRMFLAFLVGFSVHLYLPIRAGMDPAVLWADASQPGVFLEMITTGKANQEHFYNPFGDLGRFRHWARILSVYPAHELTLAGLVLGLVGGAVAYVRDRQAFVLTGMLLVFTLFMVSTYGIHDIFNYFLSIYQVLVLWFGFACARVLSLITRSSFWSRLGEGGMLSENNLRFLAIAFLLVIPLNLFVGNYAVMDRSDHLDPLDFADLVWKVVPRGSYVLSDFWTYTPLLYGKHVLAGGDGITLIPALSAEVDELERLLAELEASGVPVFLTTRFEDNPGNALGPYSLRLISPYPVQGLPTDSQPLPAYKDRLVPRGAIYRVGRGVEPEVVGAVPGEVRGEPVVFGRTIELMGGQLNPAIQDQGGILELELFWRLLRGQDRNLWADVLFTDARGGTATEAGIPVWQGSHWIGGGATPTSTWSQGQIHRERYFILIPRQAEARSYQVRILVYERGPRMGLLDVTSGPKAGTSSTVLGEVVVREPAR